MVSSNGGVRGNGRKRGRPAKLTPEQKRENAKRRQRLHRQQKAEREWLRATNSGRIIYLEVFHWLDLLEFLVALKVLDSRDVENPPAIERAVEEALGLAEIRARREEMQADYDFVDRIYLISADPTFRPTSCDPGTVRFKVTHEVADVLDLEIDDTRGIKRRLEDRLYRVYSNINDLRHPDKVGIAWGHRNYGRHQHAFEDVPPEKARAAQENFEEVGSIHRPLVRNLSSKGLRKVWRRQYSD
jgi:hypothetical protein